MGLKAGFGESPITSLRGINQLRLSEIEASPMNVVFEDRLLAIFNEPVEVLGVHLDL
jgi:hypothetical protein